MTHRQFVAPGSTNDITTLLRELVKDVVTTEIRQLIHSTPLSNIDAQQGKTEASIQQQSHSAPTKGEAALTSSQIGVSLQSEPSTLALAKSSGSKDNQPNERNLLFQNTIIENARKKNAAHLVNWVTAVAATGVGKPLGQGNYTACRRKWGDDPAWDQFFGIYLQPSQEEAVTETGSKNSEEEA
jgi:hypothetical protein